MVFSVASSSFLEDLSPAIPHSCPWHSSLGSESKYCANSFFSLPGKLLQILQDTSHMALLLWHFSMMKRQSCSLLCIQIFIFYHCYNFHRVGMICLQVPLPSGQRPFLKASWGCNVQWDALACIDIQHHLISNRINCWIRWNTCRNCYKLFIPLIPG